MKTKKAERRPAVATVSKPERFVVRPPFQSNAFKAWRIEWQEFTPDVPGGLFLSSYFCTLEVDIMLVYGMVKDVQTRKAWNDVAVTIKNRAGEFKGGVWQVSTGSHHTIISKG